MTGVTVSEGTAVTDTATNQPLVVQDHETGPYMIVPMTQVESVRQLLEANGVRFWVAHQSTSVNGKPYMSWVNIARGTDVKRVQAIFDAVA